MKFFTQQLVKIIILETNVYAKQRIKNPGELRYHCDLGYETGKMLVKMRYVILALFMPMAIDQKPILQMYLKRICFGNSCIWLCNCNEPL
jgi:hypothetical protein